MENKPPIKTNWKYIAIVVVLSLVVGGGISFVSLTGEKNPFPQVTSSTPPGIIPSEDEDKLDFSNECKQLEQQIGQLVQQANYCEADSDCIVNQEAASPLCGCPSLVNKSADMTAIETKKMEWEQNGCREDAVCGPCGPKPNYITCKANRCEGFYEQSISESLQTWQTYRNEEFGFEVSYPETCSKILEDVGSLFSVSCLVKDVEFVEEFFFFSWGHVGFSCDSIKECESNLNFSKIDYKDDNTAIIERTRRGNKEFVLVFIVKDTALDRGVGEIEIQQKISSSAEQFEEIAKQILSTFRFVEKNSP